MMDIYEEMKAANVPMSNYRSDLYVKSTPEALAILGRYEFKGNTRFFTNTVDGQVWIDIPFAYLPYWEGKRRKP